MPKRTKDVKEGEVKDEEMDVEDVVSRISFNDLEKSMTPFTGDDAYGVENFITEFEDVAALMQWSDIEKLIYSRRLLTGTAKLFLRSLGSIKSWDILKEELKLEFGQKLNSAAIHKKLASRKMKPTETYQQYFLHMKELALLGNLEEGALIEYVIDGIRDLETNKTILYGATDIKEFRKKLDIYAEIKKKIPLKPQTAPHPMRSRSTEYQHVRTKRCFNCGDTDHESPSCTKGIKCFRCNTFGHKSPDCPKYTKKTLKIYDNNNIVSLTPYKKIKINGTNVEALIDTGSDANLINETYLEKIRDAQLEVDQDSIRLKGIARKSINTKGSFSTKIEIDDCFLDATFHVVENESIPVNIILGNPVLKDIEISFKAGVISVKKILHLTTADDQDETCYNIGDIRCNDEIKTLIEDYDPKSCFKESNVEQKILLEDETPVHEHPRRLSPLELDAVTEQIIVMKHADAPSRQPIENVYVLTNTAARIRKAQNDDLKIKLIKRLSEKKPNEDYVNESGIFWKIKDGEKLMVVPKKMKNEFIRRNHEKGHFRIAKTENLLVRDFRIDNFKDMIKSVIDNIDKKENIKAYDGRRLELRQKAKESIQKIQEEKMRNYNRKRREAKTYRTGDLVAIKKTQFSRVTKLYPKYHGPYEVVKNKGKDRYTVRKIGNGQGPMNTMSSADYMKPWISAEDSSSGPDD